ncbi:MAG TPA: 5-formyltetrahydrofolate cyclo-ligase [Sphingomonas sp.]|nr:5-formyltetrahydrofolate cyclo-ligase [Sphingomonas sp.]
MAVPPPSPAPDKAALRRWARAARDAFAASAPPPVAPPARWIELLRPGLVVASYRPVGSEADPAFLAEAALERGCALALPHVVDRAGTMRFLAWHPDHALVAGPFGLEQPHHGRDEVAPDVILTPLVGFDAALHRLGQGAGHYDRAFAGLPEALRIGVAWSVQHVDPLPIDRWDVPLHAVITEQGWIERMEP